jgi:hypothetical protein
MKKALLLFLLVLGIFLGWKGARAYKGSAPLSQSYFPTEEKPFVILVTSYNTAPYVEKNLLSLFSQSYENYRLIYIDDASSDATYEKVKESVRRLDTKKRTTLIHNPSHQGELMSIYNAAHGCLDHEIVILMRGEDFFAHENVLSTLNQKYADPHVWLTFGHSLEYPSFEKGGKLLSEKIVNNQSVRKVPWTAPHPYTFYAALFKQIHLEDLFYRGHPYPMGIDQALFLPLLEMGAHHHSACKEILYLKNEDHPLSEGMLHPDLRKECLAHLRSKTPYAPLQNLPEASYEQKQSADLIIFSKDAPLQLLAFLESLHNFVSGLNKVTVLYESSGTDFETGYLELKIDFPQIKFVKKSGPFKAQITQIAFDPSPPTSSYLLFAEDTLLITDTIDLLEAISHLSKTGAYGVFFTHHPNLRFCSDLQRYEPLPYFTALGGIGKKSPPFAWQFSCGMDDWNSPNSFQCALYKKEDLKKILIQIIDYDSADALLYAWGQFAPQDKLGLFYDRAKCIQLQLNESPKFLLQAFFAGKKIFLPPLFQTSTTSKQISPEITFISSD